MLLESGLCLTLDKDKLEANGAVLGGVLTPATAFGHVLINRLRNAGMTFDILDTKQKMNGEKDNS